MSIETILEEIVEIQGVLGTCLYHTDRGPLYMNSGLDLSVSTLRVVGQHVVRMLKMARINGLDVATTSYILDKGTMLAMPLETGAVLLTICESEASAARAEQMVWVLAWELSSLLTSEYPDVAGGQKDSWATEQTGSGSSSYQELQRSIARLEEALAEVIGPLAKVVMRDSIEIWKSQGRNVMSRLPQLVDTVAVQIGDSDAVADYREMIDKVLLRNDGVRK